MGESCGELNDFCHFFPVMGKVTCWGTVARGYIVPNLIEVYKSSITQNHEGLQIRVHFNILPTKFFDIYLKNRFEKTIEHPSSTGSISNVVPISIPSLVQTVS